MRINPTYRAMLDKSISCMISAIELYNKPDFKYREDTFSILAINAWELLLKAQLLKQNKYNFKSICQTEPLKTKSGKLHKTKTIISKNRSGNKKTLNLESVINNLNKKQKIPEPIIKNIAILTELRDNAIHFINYKDISKQVQELGFACIKNYMTYIKDHNIEIDINKYNLYLMPLAYINDKVVANVEFSSEVKNFLSYFKKSKIESTSSYDVLLSIDVQFKKGNSLDAIKVKTSDNADVTISLSEEDILKNHPWNYDRVISEARKRYSNFKQNHIFYEAMSEVKKNNKLFFERKLYPDKPNSNNKTYYYSTNVWIILDKYFTKR